MDEPDIETVTGHPVQVGRFGVKVELCDCSLTDPPCIEPDLIAKIGRLESTT